MLQPRTLGRAMAAVIALHWSTMSFADTTFTFRLFTGLDACNVESPNGTTFTCPEEDALPESLALFPIEAAIVFSDESVARGRADLTDIRSFTGSAGSVLTWTLSNLHPIFSAASVTFSEDRRTITGFFGETATESVGHWVFAKDFSPRGAAIDTLQVGSTGFPDILAVSHDEFDAATGEVVRLASAEQFGRFTLAVPAAMNVALDVRGGDGSATINGLTSSGIVSITVLTTTTFDAAQINVSTVRLWPGNAVEAHNRRHVSDIDGDGDLDLVMHFMAREAGIQCGSEEVILHGAMQNGTPFIGSGPVRVICPPLNPPGQ